MSTQTQILQTQQGAIQQQMDTGSNAAAHCNIVSIAASLTLVFEASDDGVNWFGVAAYPLLAAGFYGGPVLSLVLSAASTSNQYSIPNMGHTYVRVRCSAYTSGQVTVAMDAGASGFGGVQLVNMEGQKATYSFALNAFAPQATPADLLTILGSATKTVRIIRLAARLRATAGNQYRLAVRKYSVAYTGGTPAAATLVAHDSNDAAATAVVNTWAGGTNTPGTAIGNLRDESLNVGVLGTPILEQGAGGWYDFGIRPGRALVLRGVAQYAALWANSVALPAGLVADIYGEFTEE